GVFFRHDLSPRGAKESFGVFRPFGAAFPNDTYPGLAPGATLCRRSAAEYSTGFSPSSLRKFPRPQSQLGQIAVARRECALPTQYLLSELLTHHTRGRRRTTFKIEEGTILNTGSPHGYMYPLKKF